MLWISRAAAALLLAAAMAPALAERAAIADRSVPAPAGEGPAALSRIGAHLSRGADDLVRWVRRSHDHGGLAFAVVDKLAARIHIFDSSGHWRASSPVLLGQAVGDDIAPDVGEHTQAGHVPMNERTTPAGRFVSEPGRNLQGEHVVWVDYDSAFAIHRLRPGRSLKQRERKLASADPADKRASLGCVVVPVEFYKSVVQPLLGRARAVVYVMPEQGDVRELIGGL